MTTLSATVRDNLAAWSRGRFAIHSAEAKIKLSTSFQDAGESIFGHLQTRNQLAGRLWLEPSSGLLRTFLPLLQHSTSDVHLGWNRLLALLSQAFIESVREST